MKLERFSPISASCQFADLGMKFVSSYEFV